VISLTPMPGNADLALYLVSAGTFNVYYNSKPDGDWSNPATFSDGQLIATFKRDESLFPFLQHSVFTPFQKPLNRVASSISKTRHITLTKWFQMGSLSPPTSVPPHNQLDFRTTQSPMRQPELRSLSARKGILNGMK
jgi:hypothetical protein